MVESKKREINGNGSRLLEYQMNELKTAIERGFSAVDAHLEKQDNRINDLYIWRSGIEARTLNINNGLNSKDLGKIILTILGALTLALTIISQIVGN